MTKGTPVLLLWLLLLGGIWAFSASAASAQINFAFSVGDGVNAYYLPTVSSFIYAYDGLPIRPLVRPVYRGQVRSPAFRQARPMRQVPRWPGGPGGHPPMGRPIMRTFAGPGPGGK